MRGYDLHPSEKMSTPIDPELNRVPFLFTPVIPILKTQRKRLERERGKTLDKPVVKATRKRKLN